MNIFKKSNKMKTETTTIEPIEPIVTEPKQIGTYINLADEIANILKANYYLKDFIKDENIIAQSHPSIEPSITNYPAIIVEQPVLCPTSRFKSMYRFKIKYIDTRSNKDILNEIPKICSEKLHAYWIPNRYKLTYSYCDEDLLLKPITTDKGETIITQNRAVVLDPNHDYTPIEFFY